MLSAFYLWTSFYLSFFIEYSIIYYINVSVKYMSGKIGGKIVWTIFFWYILCSITLGYFGKVLFFFSLVNRRFFFRMGKYKDNCFALQLICLSCLFRCSIYFLQLNLGSMCKIVGAMYLQTQSEIILNI